MNWNLAAVTESHHQKTKRGEQNSANKMFFYPIRHFLLSKLLMCALQIDCGRMLISTHRKFEELFREKPKVRKEAINALLIKPVIESIRCYYFSYFFQCNRHVRKKQEKAATRRFGRENRLIQDRTRVDLDAHPDTRG